jgi:hypothetical protein
LHVAPQLVPLHVAAVFGGTAHAVHELPQFEVLVLLTHSPPQRWNPLLQLKPQTPAVQFAVPFAGAVHTVEQPPQ